MFTIREVLRGLRPGRMQSVGSMQVIPLVLDDISLENDCFATPSQLSIDTSSGYGKMDFKNRSTDKPIIIPMHATVLSDQKAQDHAMVKAGLISSGRSRQYDDACCVQDSQSGILRDVEGVDIQILPYALRKNAFAMKGVDNYRKLWPYIREMNSRMLISDSSKLGWLVAFQTKYAAVLDQFVAEFECIDKQVGAIVLVDGKLLGVERAPSVRYWLDVWEPLIRMCYGSQAIKPGETRQRDAVEPLTDLMNARITTLDDLEAAVKKHISDAEKGAKEIVKQLIDDPFNTKQDDSLTFVVDGEDHDAKILSVDHGQFVGQLVTDNDFVVYASLNVQSNWKASRARRFACDFVL